MDISEIFLPFCFWRDDNGNAATLLFCVIPANAPYIKYINIRVKHFYLIV